MDAYSPVLRSFNWLPVLGFSLGVLPGFQLLGGQAAIGMVFLVAGGLAGLMAGTFLSLVANLTANNPEIPPHEELGEWAALMLEPAKCRWVRALFASLGPDELDGLGALTNHERLCRAKDGNPTWFIVLAVWWNFLRLSGGAKIVTSTLSFRK